MLETFAKATEQLNTTQPTISARIAALEDRLGVSLFDRSGHRVALTPKGRSFLRSAEKLLEIRARAVTRYNKGKLRPSRVRAALVTSPLPKLRMQHPSISTADVKLLNSRMQRCAVQFG
ncbi:LysR family transcriptional regulator [Mesorhizobium sp. M0199]|uniref:LysR family transcriptional regulator n=1 Tax=Mesorhizobium sp. M0199 TaxID=2956911 RepID=UPI00333983A5